MLPPPSLAHVVPDRERERERETDRQTDGQTSGQTDRKYLRAVEVETGGFLGFIGLCMLAYKHPCTCVQTHTHTHSHQSLRKCGNTCLSSQH